MNREQIGVVFINYHSEAMIAPRLDALVRAGFNVVVADNSGSFPQRSGVLRMSENVGFGSACNRAVASMPEAVRVVCFHNPDADAEAAVIEELAARLVEEHRPGIIAPALVTDGQVRPRGFRYPTPAREAILACRAGLQIGRSASLAPQSEPKPRGGGGRRFGSCSLAIVARPAFQEVGGFDETFFLYGEDLDLWHRLALSGHSTGFAPEIRVHHRRKAGSPIGLVRRELLRWVGVELFAERHDEGWRRLRAAHFPVLRRMRGQEPELARLMWAGYCRLATPSRVAVAVRNLLGESTTQRNGEPGPKR